MFERVILAMILSSIWTTAASAHGATGMDRGECRMKIDQYEMRFTGYQGGLQPFCDDIPEIGVTSISLDVGSDVANEPLRSMNLDMRILRNVGQTNPEENEAANTLVYEPPKSIAKGTYYFQYDFKEKGDYIGVVKAYAPDGRVLRAVFPFSVGVSGQREMMAAGVAGLVALVGGWLFYRNIASKKNPA